MGISQRYQRRDGPEEEEASRPQDLDKYEDMMREYANAVVALHEHEMRCYRARPFRVGKAQALV